MTFLSEHLFMLGRSSILGADDCFSSCWLADDDHMSRLLKADMTKKYYRWRWRGICLDDDDGDDGDGGVGDW